MHGDRQAQESPPPRPAGPPGMLAQDTSATYQLRICPLLGHSFQTGRVTPSRAAATDLGQRADKAKGWEGPLQPPPRGLRLFCQGPTRTATPRSQGTAQLRAATHPPSSSLGGGLSSAARSARKPPSEPSGAPGSRCHCVVRAPDLDVNAANCAAHARWVAHLTFPTAL